MDNEFLAVVASALVATVPDMPTDPRKLKPGELCRILNSTPVGEVLNDRKLRGHRTKAGLRIGDGKTIDLFRYAAWLTDEHLSFTPLTSLASAPSAADLQRQRAARRSRENFASVSDIGELPDVVNPEQRDACEHDLELFLQTYFPNSTGLSPFSDDHKRVIARIQRCLTKGGRFCNTVYRGFAKTTISINSAIWAVLYGHRKYCVLFGAEKKAAEDNISAIKTELAENDLLLDDFPEVCRAIRALEGKHQRCGAQTYRGKLTHINWKADRVVLPRMPDSRASGAIIACRGITGSGTRGLNHRTPEGTAQRPDAAIIDDIQTDRSAVSPHQVNGLLGTIKRSVLKLGGHKSSIACVVNATVIAADDVVEQLLDPKRNPSWQGERIKMVRKWTDAHETLWLEEYARIRNTFDREDPDDQRRAQQDATAYYIANQAVMDAGGEISWEGCFDPEVEVSAIQHAYNFLIDDGPDVFATECQVEPPKATEADECRMSASEVITRINGFDRGTFPHSCNFVTAFIDVQDPLLYWVACAWESNFTGFVVDYGTWPDQNRHYFRLHEAQRTLALQYPGDKIESQWMQGLGDLANMLGNRQWQRHDGTYLRLGKLLIDANYGSSTPTVKSFCQTSPWAPILMASHGRGITAGDLPMAMYTPKPGEQHGFNWIVRPEAKIKGQRHVTFDTNFWKSFVHNRLRGRAPESGSLSLWGKDGREHEMFADQFAAEKPTRTEGRGRKVTQWELPANKPDNHWFDGVVGCAVGASMLGVSLTEHETPKPKPRRKLVVEFD